jgi:hypothetical protein
MVLHSLVHILYPPQKFEHPHHFGIVADTVLKLWHRGQLQWHEFYKNLPIVSKVVWGNTQTG